MCTTYCCSVERQLSKTLKSFLLTLHTNLCLALDCQTGGPVTYNITPINITAFSANNYNENTHYNTAVVTTA